MATASSMIKYGNLLTYRKSLPKNKNSIFIYCPSCHSKLVWLSSVEQKQIFWIIQKVLVTTDFHCMNNKNTDTFLKISQTEVLGLKERKYTGLEQLHEWLHPKAQFILNKCLLLTLQKFFKNLYIMNVISINVIRCTCLVSCCHCHVTYGICCVF